MDTPEYSITVDSTELRAINKVSGKNFAEVTLTNFDPSVLTHQILKRAADSAVYSSRGVVKTIPKKAP